MYLALGLTEEARSAAYRDLFRYELDEAALTDLRSALAQGQPLGNERFKEALSAATRVRRTQARRGRPAALADKAALADQTEFGF